jgi:hypothetical protein
LHFKISRQMQIDFKHYLTVIQTELQANWKPLTAMAGVAILVTVIWGKVALIGFGLVCFAGYIVLGPSIKVMNYLDLKGCSSAAVLIGNWFFGWVNPALLNLYSGACMIANEWNFSRINSTLTSQNENLQARNKEMSQACDQWKKTIETLEQQFQTLLEKTTEVVPIKQQLDARSSEVVNRMNRDTQEIQSRLDRLGKLATMVLEKIELGPRVAQELSVLKNQHQVVCALYQENLVELIELKKAMRESLSNREVVQVQEQQKLAELSSMINKLKPLPPKEGYL